MNRDHAEQLSPVPLPSSVRERPLSIVLLSYPSESAGLMLEHLMGRGHIVKAVVLQRDNLVRRLRCVFRVVGARRTLALVWRKVVAVLGWRKREPWREDRFYLSRAEHLVVVPHLNHAACRQALSALQPDIAVIGSAGVLRPEVFTVPRLGTLNVHPGVLPRYRGLSSACWAILEGGDVGATLHFVDSGIDTGPIVSQQVVEVRAGDSLPVIKRRVYEVGLELLTNALEAIARGDPRSVLAQARMDGRYYHVAPASAERMAEARLASLAAATPLCDE